MKNLFDVSGKTILVTGASRGIGKVFAEGFRDSGAIVYGTGSKQESIEWMNDSGIQGRVADITKPGSMTPIIDEIRSKHGRLDCLINNAGYATNKPASAFKEDEIYKIIDTNFAGVFRACQAYYKAQKKDGGNIINIASVLGLRGYSLSSVYCGTKGAVIQLTKALAAEWIGAGFKVNAICPGFIDTDMTIMLKEKPQILEQLNSSIPLKRMGKPEELLGTAIFLASDASSYIMGQSIVVDGGLIEIMR
ncbi:MAG: SDR family oxidoreductase [Leptospira sp.]|nr:SDR family oxidoreductase [Leptospira sp.]